MIFGHSSLTPSRLGVQRGGTHMLSEFQPHCASFWYTLNWDALAMIYSPGCGASLLGDT
jgi:hypothetical protein